MFFPDIRSIGIKKDTGQGKDLRFVDGAHVIGRGGVLEEVSGIEALKNWILKVVLTQKNAYEVYRKDEKESFGISVYDRLGTKFNGFWLSEIKREITEQLTANERINEVYDFKAEYEKRELRISFAVSTIFGEAKFEEDHIIFDGGGTEPEPVPPPSPSGDELRGVMRVNGRIDEGIRGEAV